MPFPRRPRRDPRETRHARRPVVAALAAVVLVGALGLTPATTAAAGVTVTSIGVDPFSQATCAASGTTNHQADVEPDSFAYGSEILAAYQVGRIYNGGACAIGWSFSSDDGATWTSGLLPSITKWTTAIGAGSWDRVTDPAIAYDARHGLWLISTLSLTESGGVQGKSVLTSSSTDGTHWAAPVTTDASSLNPDKNWIVCDNTSTSPYYGNCYTEWDDNGAGNKLYMSTSSDGGRTWSAKATNGAGVIGGQPVVRPDGIVIVPTDNAYETSVGAFSSSNGGLTWSNVTTIARINHHRVAGSLREGPLPTAEIDAAGTVYVAWSDCRFRSRCVTNDIVFAKSTNATGTRWSSVTRVPIDATGSGIDHFIPGLGVDPRSSGATARLGLTYYFYPSGSTQLSVGFVSSTTGGASWTTPQTIVEGMSSAWAANSSQGRMVGDYISTSFDANGVAHGVFGAAYAPTSGTSCTTSALDNCRAPIQTFALAPGVSGGAAGAALAAATGPVLFGAGGGAGLDRVASLWKLVDNQSLEHRH